jgi:hypothetical protein
MGSIPYSASPAPYEDRDTGVLYLLKPICGDTEVIITGLLDTIPTNEEERKAFFSKLTAESAAFIDGIIDSVLVGWESKKRTLPAFPQDGHPSKQMKRGLKVKIANYALAEKELTEEDLKK